MFLILKNKGIKMKHYVEITILDTDNKNHILSKLYSNVHGFINNKNIGVSFPNYNNKNLGNKIRIFSNTKNKLDNFKFSEALSDYVQCTKILNTPDNVKKYCIYKKVNLKQNKDYLVKRCSKRKGISLNDAYELYCDFAFQHSSSPYITLKSKSTGKNFRIYINKIPTNNLNFNNYSNYGLSNDSCVPEF